MNLIVMQMSLCISNIFIYVKVSNLQKLQNNLKISVIRENFCYNILTLNDYKKI